MKIINGPDIPLHQMKDGDIGIITKWTHNGAIGQIVQRYGDGPHATLFVLGEGKGSSYTALFTHSEDERLKVRILPKGTYLEI